MVDLAAHGLSYTPDQVRRMTGRDLAALIDAANTSARRQAAAARRAQRRR